MKEYNSDIIYTKPNVYSFMCFLSNVKYLIEVERNKVKYGSLQVLTIFTHFQQKKKNENAVKSKSKITQYYYNNNQFLCGEMQ